MSSTIKFLTNNAIDNSTFTMLSGVENAQFPLSNISKVFTTKSFRSTGTSCVIQIDFGQNVTIDTIALVGNNITGLGITTATIEFSPTIVFPGTSIETISLSSEYNFGFVLNTQGSYRYAKLTLTATSFCELSNLYIGSRTELLNNNIDVNSFKYSVIDNFKAKSNNYGQVFIDEYNMTNQMSGTIKYVNDTEFNQLNDVYSTSGNTTPVWFMLDSDGSLGSDTEFIFSGYFRLSGALGFKMVAPGLYDVNISLAEVV